MRLSKINDIPVITVSQQLPLVHVRRRQLTRTVEASHQACRPTGSWILLLHLSFKQEGVAVMHDNKQYIKNSAHSPSLL